jgi:CRISPR-associated protein Cas6
MQIEVSYPVEGDLLPSDSHYLLYSALSHVVPAFHSPERNVRFGPIGGAVGGKGLIRLTPRSHLRVRLPAEDIALVLPLAGKRLQIGEYTVRLKPPTVRELIPAPQLLATVVTFKHSQDPERFLQVARGMLDKLGIAAEPGIPLFEDGPRAGEPRRRVIRIKDKRIVGFSLLVAGLTAEESVRLQEEGLGGRRRIGCGFFVPFRPR